jgi:hypothetical protein
MSGDDGSPPSGGLTEIIAFVAPEHYFSYLAYSSLSLAAAVLLWSWKYLLFVRR